MNPKDCVPKNVYKIPTTYGRMAKRKLDKFSEAEDKARDNAWALEFGDRIHPTTSWLMKRV
jgi:hypothetical protein